MSLYLKYRPKDFENLVWQDFIKNTLQKAIIQDKIIWAYLFCWPRWTWKTSTARLLAKTINCKNNKNGNPCLKCDICKDFLDEKLIDIIEIDAASHTWVDNIRDLIEKAQFKPTKTKYKIYIIDEVHMLSKWAFNALLKILEEPPEHIKFILATTETHKVPETIISRCQRFDFKRINKIDISNRLNFIAENEWIKIDEKSIEYIIKNSWGWLRNAISLFEQFILDKEIKFENITKNLWLVSNDFYKDFLDKLIKKDEKIINLFENLIDEWKNLKLFFKEFIFYTKDFCLNELKKERKIEKIIKIMDILDETYSKTKNSLDENTTFLIWILKIISDFQDKIYKKEEKIENLKQIWEKKIEEKTKIVKENKISQDDIFDIFQENEKKQIKNNENNSSFDKNIFIQDLKENWAKWWLTMALRWTEIYLDWKNLKIQTKTKIAKWQITNKINLEFIKKTLEKNWFWEINIIID